MRPSAGKWYLEMKVLIFAPHSGIWAHTFPEALIGEALKQNGHEIIYISCDQSLDEFCTVMAALGLNHDANQIEKQKICHTCTKYKSLIVNQFNFKNYSIKDALSSDDNTTVDLKLNKITRENFLELEIDGVEVGRLTLYQILLEYKKNSLDFSDKEWRRFLIDLKNSLKVFYSVKKILSNEKPDAVIVYNSLYAVNNIFCQLAQKYQIKQYFLHAGGNLATRLETMILAEGDGFKYYHALLERWHDFKHIPCTKQLISKVCAHLLSVIRGDTVFSYSMGLNKEQVDIRQYFHISENQKIILATMSSNDERFASTMVKAYKPSNSILFVDQFEWLRRVIQYVKGRVDLFLIIRVHPRELPNRRESVISQNYAKMQELFSELPKNVRINWPDDKISLYHLAQHVDLCLNSWSSAGKELAALGIPVLLYSKELQVYPPDINEVGESDEEYFKLFEMLLIEGWSFERCRVVFRWYAFEYFRTTLDISDSFKTQSQHLTARIYRKCLRVMDSAAIQKMDCRQRVKRMKSAKTINAIFEGKKKSILDILDPNSVEKSSIEDETKSLKAFLRTIYNLFIENNVNMSPLLLKFNHILNRHETHLA